MSIVIHQGDLIIIISVIHAMLSVASGLLLDGYHSPIFNKKYKKTCQGSQTRDRHASLRL